MSSPTQRTIAELEYKFTEQPSIRNSVQSSGGDIIRINKAIWIASPVLRNHQVHGDSYKVLNTSKEVLESLCEAFENGKFPSDFTSLLDLLAVASELELESVTKKCFEILHKMEAFYELDYPPECSTETVMRCLRVFLDSPPRTVEIYEQQLNRIARHCSNDRDVMLNAINLMKQMLEKYIHTSLEGIPVGFNRLRVPIIIFRRSGRRQAAIIDGNEIRPVNLFGEHLNLDAFAVGDLFYLKYGSYLLYKSGEYVYYKNLQDDSDPVDELNDCTIFVARGNIAFAVRRESYCHSISLWTNDEEFVKIYESTREIQMLDFEYDTRVLAVLLEGSTLLLFRLENSSLFLLHEARVPRLKNVLISGNDMFYIMSDGEGLTVETHRNPTMSGEVPQRPVDTDSDDENFWRLSSDDDYNIECFCGTYYLFENRRLEILPNFPSRSGRRPLLTEAELCSISELWLLP